MAEPLTLRDALAALGLDSATTDVTVVRSAYLAAIRAAQLGLKVDAAGRPVGLRPSISRRRPLWATLLMSTPGRYRAGCMV